MRQKRHALTIAALTALAAAFALPVAAGTDCWTYTPPASGTRGTISWTDSSGFENIINGIILSDGAIDIYPNCNRGSTTLRNADFSLPVRDGDGNALAYSPDFLAGKRDTGSAVLGYITELTNVVVNANAVALGNYCFKGCTALVRVRLNEGLETIGHDAFIEDTALATVENFLPDSVTSVGGAAFRGCKALPGPVVARGLKTIGERAFHTCPALLGADLGDSSIETFPDFVFYNCSSLGSLVLPPTTTALGNGICEGCTSLTNVTPLLPPKLVTLGSDNNPAFKDCPIQGHVVVPSTLERVGNRAFRLAKIETFTAPKKGLRSIGQYAFFQNSNLTNIVLSAEMEEITANWIDGSGTSGVEQHVYFRNLPATLPSNLWAGTKKQNITIHLPWSQEAEWRAWVASGPSGHTFTFGGAAKTLPARRTDVGTWLSSVTQNVTWWKDVDSPLVIVVR
ncbi:MAG: leucine-rich repeat domain-containing protein [Kiritimatiellae bacterium]|nr:leucine-rich repeat domain-containing protein [Kiritimatiellia bacterium]